MNFYSVYVVLLLLVVGSKADGEDQLNFYRWTTYSDSKCTNPIGQMYYFDYYYLCDPVTSCTQYGTSGQYYKLDCNQTLSRSFPEGWVAIISDNQYPGEVGTQVPCQYPDQVYAGVPNTCIVYPTEPFNDLNSFILGDCDGDQNSIQIYYYSDSCSGDYYDDFLLYFNDTCPLQDNSMAYVQRYCGSVAEPQTPPTTNPIAPNSQFSSPVANPTPSDTPIQSPAAAPDNSESPVGGPSAQPQNGPVPYTEPNVSIPSISPPYDTPTTKVTPATPVVKGPAASHEPTAAGSTPRSLTSAAVSVTLANCLILLMVISSSVLRV